MGCIRERSGKWMLDFYDHGKRRWVTTRWAATEENRAKAVKELGRHEDAVRDGVFLSKSQRKNFAEFYPALQRAKLRRVRFHGLRHTCASLLLAAGVNVRAVQEQLGHASATITLNVYGHLMPGSGSPGADAFQANGGSTAVAEADAESMTRGSSVVPMPVRTAS